MCSVTVSGMNIKSWREYLTQMVQYVDTNPYPHTLLTYNLQNIPDSDNQKTVTTKEQQIWTTKQAYPQLEQLV